jgi:hypothetical protein
MMGRRFKVKWGGHEDLFTFEAKGRKPTLQFYNALPKNMICEKLP